MQVIVDELACNHRSNARLEVVGFEAHRRTLVIILVRVIGGANATMGDEARRSTRGTCGMRFRAGIAEQSVGCCRLVRRLFRLA